MTKRKTESRVELEARRQERRRRGKKRSVSPQELSAKKNKTQHSPNYGESVVTVSDASDVEMKSDSVHSEPEEGKLLNKYQFLEIHNRLVVDYNLSDETTEDIVQHLGKDK